MAPQASVPDRPVLLALLSLVQCGGRILLVVSDLLVQAKPT